MARKRSIALQDGFYELIDVIDIHYFAELQYKYVHETSDGGIFYPLHLRD